MSQLFRPTCHVILVCRAPKFDYVHKFKNDAQTPHIGMSSKGPQI